jgi:hypothetical protein
LQRLETDAEFRRGAEQGLAELAKAGLKPLMDEAQRRQLLSAAASFTRLKRRQPEEAPQAPAETVATIEAPPFRLPETELPDTPEHRIGKPIRVTSPGYLSFLRDRRLPLGDRTEMRAAGRPVLINNPLLYATGSGEGLYTLRDNKWFATLFDPARGEFEIRFAKPPESSLRQFAEQDLVKILGVNREEACLLKIKLIDYSRPQSPVSPETMRLSFCR